MIQNSLHTSYDTSKLDDNVSDEALCNDCDDTSILLDIETYKPLKLDDYSHHSRSHYTFESSYHKSKSSKPQSIKKFTETVDIPDTGNF